MRRLRNLLLTATALMPIAPALAGPQGGVVVGGSAQIQNQGTANVTINQFSDKTIINWNLFNIGAGEKTTFVQPSVNSIALNKVVGGKGPSEILGSLNANGKVFVVNPDGIIFGAGAVITTAGFLATTSDIRNQDFMAGRFNFNIPGRPDASIVNMGTITATNGGFAALVAPGVRNSGTITANLGSVTLASGNTFSLDFYGDKLVQLGVGDEIAGQVKDVATGQTLKSLVTNEGKLKANGGRVELTAAAARHVVDSVINTSGVIEANSVGMKNGQIVLAAATAAPKASGPGGRGGASTAVASSLPPQKVKVSGTLSAAGKKAGTKGGTITITGEHIEVAGATINASGQDGGGKVMIGGDWAGGKPDTTLVSNQSAKLENYAIPTATTVSIDAATKIDASAKDKGDGGKVVVWSDQTTSFAGTILALGGAQLGNGGFVETSGKGQLNFTGNVSTLAPNGKAGTLLLDPENYTIWNGSGPTPSGSSITNTDLQNQLANGDVVIATNNSAVAPGQNGDIFVNAPVVWNASTTLTLNAFRDVVFAFLVSPNIKNTGGGNLVVHADITGANNTGSVIFNAGTTPQRVDWSGSTGKVSFYYNPGSYAAPTNYSSGVVTNGAVPGQFTAYMLVHNATNLQNISTNLAGNYALSKNVNASSIPNFTPLQTFSGKFDGQNFTISNLNIAPVNPVNFGIGVGMFTTIGTGGVVKNLNFVHATVTANPNATGPGQFVGVLAGSNAGTVTNVNVDSTSAVTAATALHGVIAGGLIGQNGDVGQNQMGTIANSSSAANVSVGSGQNFGGQNTAGGLVGSNPAVGANLATITDSFATGNVSGGAFSSVGGLVGLNAGTINGTLGSSISGSFFSFASGNVSVSDATGTSAGGLVGFNFGAINNSIAMGNVTAGNSNNISTAGNVGGLVGQQNAGGSINTSFAIGNVTAGTKSTAGGLVGFNNGSIENSGAAGAVSAVDNQAGGLAGFNGQGATITGSFATGNVSGGGFGVGGLVGDNAGTIVGSIAFGNVTSNAPNSPNHESEAGGFVGNNSGTITGSFAFGNVASNNNAGGFVGSNSGTIDSSFAGLPSFPGFPSASTVTVGNNATAGGFAGGNHGNITNSTAFGNVSGGANSVVGGFAAGHLDGAISDSVALGSVSSTGPNSIVGGFAGLSTAGLTRVTSSGAVSGTSDSFLGGLVGINIAKITDSSSSSSVTGSGANNFAGGLVGVNFGNVDPSTSTGNVSSGANSTVGILIGANAAIRFPDGTQIIGTKTADSIGTGSATGGPGSTVGGQVGRDYPVTGLPELPQDPCGNGAPGPLCGGTLFNPNPVNPQQPTNPQLPDRPIVDIPAAIVQSSPQANITATLTADVKTEPKSDLVINNQTGSGGSGSGSGSPGGQKGGGAGGNAGRPPANVVAAYGLGPLPSGMPPINETRFLNDEVVFQLGGRLSDQELASLLNQLGLQVLYQEDIGLLGRKVLRLKLPGGTTVRRIIAELEKKGANFAGQPVYQYEMVQDLAQAPSPADTNRRGDSAQYIVEKLALPEAHLIATGKDVKVAVIDSEIDRQHPDLAGAIADNFDALPSDEKTAHPHGTGMAGAIVSHRRLLGVAPNARILGVRAFGVNTGGAQGTSMNIVKGLQWAVDQGAKVINMSFAGPKDPILQQAMQRLTDQGIILIAAAGNAGPKSPPLFPGADKNVIAVSATDVDNKTYKNANRGPYVAISAPGVDILVPAPEGGYQLTTGTSVAAAHISGVVALMLERNKELKPAEVRSILTGTAKNIGGVKTDVGAGLVDPAAALGKSGPKSARLQ
jgi:filamentous hemagglutinin family protein